MLLRRRVDVAAQNPVRRYLCKYLNLRTHKLGLSAARKQMFWELQQFSMRLDGSTPPERD